MSEARRTKGGFSAETFDGMRFAVLGLGRSGRAAALALRTMGAEVMAWDDDAAKRDSSLPIRPLLGQRYNALVLSPGIAHRLPAPHPVAAEALARGVPIFADVELLFRAVRRNASAARFAGVTGTNGKSTTTALLAHVLEAEGELVAAGANLGPPALGLKLLPASGIYCLEMSSYMLERTAALAFDAAALLNISPDHLDRHGDMAGYAAAKRAIFDHMGPEAVAVVGVDDPYCRAIADGLEGPRVVRISALGAADVWAEAGILRDASGELLDLGACPALPGAHNAQNAAAAAALAMALGVRREALPAAFASFPGLPHRQRLVAEIGGVRFIDDSKGTNADAAARALACYERVVWIAGGIAKAGGIAPLAPCFPRVAEALLIGRDADVFAATLAEAGVAHRVVGTLAAAVAEALPAAQRTGAGVVLLSPAAASFDQFSGFEERGTRFAALAQALADAGAGGA